MELDVNHNIVGTCILVKGDRIVDQGLGGGVNIGVKCWDDGQASTGSAHLRLQQRPRRTGRTDANRKD
jgi:hypothetical protein